jgi:hypothetical protein
MMRTARKRIVYLFLVAALLSVSVATIFRIDARPPSVHFVSTSVNKDYECTVSHYVNQNATGSYYVQSGLRQHRYPVQQLLFSGSNASLVIQQALNQGGTVLLAQGNYSLEEGVTMNVSQTTLEGEAGTFLSVHPGSTFAAISITTAIP